MAIETTSFPGGPREAQEARVTVSPRQASVTPPVLMAAHSGPWRPPLGLWTTTPGATGWGGLLGLVVALSASAASVSGSLLLTQSFLAVPSLPPLTPFVPCDFPSSGLLPPEC